MCYAQAFGWDLNDITRSKRLYHLLGSCELIHNGTLICDDIEDSSVYRRGQPCTYKKYGIDIGVNTGNLVYFQPLNHFQHLFPDPVEYAEIMKIFIEEMTVVHYGQNWDICWHKGMHLPTESQYLQMVAHKTGVLPRLCSKAVCVLAGVDEDKRQQLHNLAESIGVAFQIQDDIIALVSEEYAKERGMVGEDIHEGKRTLMVLHSIAHGEKKDSTRLHEILNLQTDNEELIKEAISLIQKTDSVNFAADKAKSILTEAWTEAAHVLPESEGKENLRQLAEFLIDRDI